MPGPARPGMTTDALPGEPLATVRPLELRRNAVKRKQAQHVTDRNAWLTRFDPGDRLDVYAQPGSGDGLAFAGSGAGQPGCGAHVLDCLQGVAADICRDALALGHAGLSLDAARHKRGVPA